MAKKKSRHIPRTLSEKNILRCILLSIDDGTVLTYDMCGSDFDEAKFNRLLKLLVDQGIVEPIDESGKYSDTSGLIISNYEKSDYFTKSNFKISIERIGKELVPLLNMVAAAANLTSTILK